MYRIVKHSFKLLTEREILKMKENQNILAIKAIIENIASARVAVANSKKSVADILPTIIESLKGKDFEKVAKLLFYKIGKTTFYNLYLREFFKASHFILEYNIKKDKIEWYGSFESIKPEKYLEYFQEKALERVKEKAALSVPEKIKRDFAKIEKLSKAELEILSKLITEKLHKAI